MSAADDAYSELSYYTLAHPDSALIHQHIVDARIAQYADETAKPIALAFALIGLHLYVEQNRSGREVQRVHMDLARTRKEWPSFALPKQRGAVTVHDVVAAPPGEARDRAIHEWCICVWSAWKDCHAQVRALLQDILADPHYGRRLR